MGLLAETFRTRLEAYLQAHDPTRVLIGGLPDFLLERIAATWASGFHLFLVSKANGSLPANVERCRADDLTAERQHGWAALVSASESRDIQESIRSAGAGTVRELWQAGFPWHPCELPGVRWADIRNDFIDRLGLSTIRKDVAACIDEFREELLGEVDAGSRFYGALDALTNAGVTYADVSYQLGFPAHSAGRVLRRRADRECVLGLLAEFVEKFKEEGADEALAQLLDVAHARYANSTDAAKKTSVEAAIKFFAAQFRHLDPADAENPVRAWRCVFETDRSHWDALSADVLLELLGPSDDRPTFATCVVNSGPGINVFDIGENQVIVRDRNAPSPAVTAAFEFGQALVTQAADAAAASAPWRLFARVNRTLTQLANPLPGGKGPHQYAVPLPTEGKQGLRFQAGPNSTSQRATSKTQALWECCQDYPLILATSHAKLRAGKRKRSKDENGNTRYEVEQDITMSFQGRLTLHGYIYRLQGSLNFLKPGESLWETMPGLTPLPNSLCQEFVFNVDVVEGAEISFTWVDSSGVQHRATVSFDFKGEVGPREDSMTGVLLRAHAGAGAKQLKDHLRAIRSGQALPPGELSVKETGKPISLWEVHQQNVQHGWWPILVSEGDEIREQRLIPCENSCLFASSLIKLNEQANAWRSVIGNTTPLGPLPPQIEAYAGARSNVLAALAKQFKLAPGETMDEVNLARKSAIGLLQEDLLKQYLLAFTALLRAAKQAALPPLWHWHAWCVDSVLLFERDSTGPAAHLLGPFHPISLARLFFVQRCLGERLLDDDNCTLANLFAGSEPIALGHVMDAQLQPAEAIAFPSGEPHWLWLHRQKGQSDLPTHDLVEWLRQAGLDPQTGPLGLDADILPQTLK